MWKKENKPEIDLNIYDNLIYNKVGVWVIVIEWNIKWCYCFCIPVRKKSNVTFQTILQSDSNQNSMVSA